MVPIEQDEERPHRTTSDGVSDDSTINRASATPHTNNSDDSYVVVVNARVVGGAESSDASARVVGDAESSDASARVVGDFESSDASVGDVGRVRPRAVDVVSTTSRRRRRVAEAGYAGETPLWSRTEDLDQHSSLYCFVKLFQRVWPFAMVGKLECKSLWWPVV